MGQPLHHGRGDCRHAENPSVLRERADVPTWTSEGRRRILERPVDIDGLADVLLAQLRRGSGQRGRG